MAAKYNRPAPHQDIFVPHPVPALSTQSSKSVGHCAKQGCARQRNKGCTFSMCKSCCIIRPANDKLCIEHRRRGGGTTVPAPHRSHLSAPTPVPRLPLSIPPRTPPPSQPVENTSATPRSSQLAISPPLGQRPTSTFQRPEIKDHAAVPREQSHHRRGGRPINSYSNCTVHIWVMVCFNKILCYVCGVEYCTGWTASSSSSHYSPPSPKVLSL
jgi:hypothetical protein